MITKTQQTIAIIIFTVTMFASVYAAYILRGREIGVGPEYIIPLIFVAIYLYIYCNNEEDPTARRKR